MHPVNPLSGNVLYFIILLCLMPDDFIPRGGSAATQWVFLPVVFSTTDLVNNQASKVHLSLSLEQINSSRVRQDKMLSATLLLVEFEHVLVQNMLLDIYAI
jgi:hypothetical protein